MCLVDMPITLFSEKYMHGYQKARARSYLGYFLMGSDNQKTSSGQTVHHLLKSRQLQRIPVVGQEAVSQKDQMKGTVGRIRQQVMNPPDEALP
jgi:hypothetical protein